MGTLRPRYVRVAGCTAFVGVTNLVLDQSLHCRHHELCGCLAMFVVAVQGSLEHVKAASAKLRHMLASVSNIDDADDGGGEGKEDDFGASDVLPPLVAKETGSGAKLVQVRACRLFGGTIARPHLALLAIPQ